MDGSADALRYPWPEPPEHGTALEVAEGILWMRLPLPMRLDHVNVYALDDGDSWTIIDTGFASKKRRISGQRFWPDLWPGNRSAG